MKAWNIILATIVIFGAGVFTGGLLVNQVEHQRRPHPSLPTVTQPPQPETMPPEQVRPEFLNKQFVEQLDDQLQLTKDQREQIQKIISQGQQNTRDLWKAVAPSFKGIWNETRQQIRNVLTPEQRKKFAILMQRQHRPPSSTNAPPVQVSTNGALLQTSTNVPPAQPAVPTNVPGL